jgi:glycosyltransferase involved in cell wall biosynthesis
MNTESATGESARSPRLAYIIGTYPGLTTTFIDREIRALRRQGVHLQIISIRKPHTRLSAEQEVLQEGVVYLIPISGLRFLGAQLRYLFTQSKEYTGVLRYLLSAPHASRKSRFKTLLHFLEGVYAAEILRRYAIDHLHAHFADRAATVALVASRLLGIPYSLTAHANDIYVDPVLLPQKISAASFVITCTRYNQAYLQKLTGPSTHGKLKCIYHGLELDHYKPHQKQENTTLRLLAVGQLKEKKGFSYLIEACFILKRQGVNFNCEIIGEGPLRDELTARIGELSLEGCLTLSGALPHNEIIRKYQEADIFVLPAVLGADGDRDGIPNVIIEAMAMGLAVVSTHHSGIPEVIQAGYNGLLATPADAPALAAELDRLAKNPALRRELGKQARRTVLEKFDIEKNAVLLLGEFSHP